jgi:hypothetical protein
LSGKPVETQEGGRQAAATPHRHANAISLLREGLYVDRLTRKFKSPRRIALIDGIKDQV